MLRLGVIADDFTGASDAASFLVQAGIPTVMYSGVPGEIQQDGAAAVIALKTRTAEVSSAVGNSLAALRALRSAGAGKIYIKYCSTFDSRPQGNIGPIVDAVMEEMHVRRTVLDPALPVNGRTVKEGVLYVNGVPLAESPMKDHPLTPMWASSIAELMRKQGKHTVIPVSGAVLREEDVFLRLMAALQDRPVYFVPDHCQDEDAAWIIRRFGGFSLLTGGSALVGEWGKTLGQKTEVPPSSAAPGGCILLAGSCSVATRKQIAHWQGSGRPSLRLTPEMALHPEQASQAILDKIQADAPCLVYASDTPQRVAAAQAAYPDLDRKIEQTLALLAAAARERGVTRWIVAGGETSGAVAKALGYSAFRIGESIAPGVPVMIPLEAPQHRLILKSGNFGQEDFFTRALERTEKA